jgi:two-component system, NtrC family, sensor kinase
VTPSQGAVLIVDDSLTVRMDLTEAFEGAGFDVRACASVSEAKSAIGERGADLFVLDVVLPDGDGVSLLAELRSRPGDAPARVMMLSSEAEVKDRVRALHTGADEYVGKPYDRGDVIARARNLLRDRTGSSRAQPTVLVVDDSVTYRSMLAGALEESGYRVVTAESGEEGLRLAADETPSAMIVDAQLAGIDGTTVIRRIRLDEALRGTPCVLLTSDEERDLELRALDSGADCFERKGSDVGQIIVRLAALLRSADSATRDGNAPRRSAKRILLTEAYGHVSDTAASELRADGYDVVVAHSGEDTLAMLTAQPVECVVLDRELPGMDALEVCRRIKTAPTLRDVPIVVFDDRSDPSAMIESLAAGADDHLAKRSGWDVLRARVRAQIRRKHFEDESRRVREQLLLNELEATEARASKQLAETRAALVEQLERKNRELEAFSYSVSHDLRAPLRSIDGFTHHILRDYADKLDERGQSYLRRVRAAAQRMGELIDDLLQLSRVERAELRPTRVDLGEIAQDVIGELRKRDADRDVEVFIEPELVVEADPRLMKVALENLLGNSWKFTSKRESPRIEIRRAADGPRTFVIRDNGAGFDMKFAGQLFRPFQRLHGEAEFPGTGIGLATVQRIVDRHGGHVWAEAAVNEGTSIYFTIRTNDAGGSA